jgi:hypothetical protein
VACCRSRDLTRRKFSGEVDDPAHARYGGFGSMLSKKGFDSLVVLLDAAF